jgi:hypothetical protein
MKSALQTKAAVRIITNRQTLGMPAQNISKGRKDPLKFPRDRSGVSTLHPSPHPKYG